MKSFVCLLMIALGMMAMPSRTFAAPITLTFEGAGNYAGVNNFYNGGTDTDGHSGVNYGIVFSSTSLAVIDSDAGGAGNIGNEPSASTVLFFLSGGAATMNVAAGFDTGFSFFYSSSTAGFVNVYDGLNDTGNLLATINLIRNIDGCVGDPTGDFCQFSAIGVTFEGIAHSVDFGGTANQIGFDNITIGSDIAGTPADVPEPVSLALAIVAFAGMVVARRRHAS